MTRAEILDKAKTVVTGQREQNYGSPEANFGLIGQLWTVYLNHLVTAQDVANMMCLFKIARIRTGRGTEDSYIDAAGYMACGGEIATADAENAKSKDYLKMATDAMKSKYSEFLRHAIEEQTEDKHIPAGHIPAGIKNGPFVPSCPPKEGSKCCCTDDIKKIAAENERKRELLRAIFGTVTVPDESGDESEAEADSIADIVKELREISDNLYRVAHDLHDLEEDEDE